MFPSQQPDSPEYHRQSHCASQMDFSADLAKGDLAKGDVATFLATNYLDKKYLKVQRLSVQSHFRTFLLILLKGVILTVGVSTLGAGVWAICAPGITVALHATHRGMELFLPPSEVAHEFDAIAIWCFIAMGMGVGWGIIFYQWKRYRGIGKVFLLVLATGGTWIMSSWLAYYFVRWKFHHYHHSPSVGIVIPDTGTGVFAKIFYPPPITEGNEGWFHHFFSGNFSAMICMLLFAYMSYGICVLLSQEHVQNMTQWERENI